MPNQSKITGIILAGGLGTRMGTVKKALLEVGGKTILRRLLDVYTPLFDEVIIAARDTKDFSSYGVPVALDHFQARSSLTGIHAGLKAMNSSHGFFAACDTPFLRPGLVQRLLTKVTPDDDVVIPIKEDGYREPLCAVYSKRCLEMIDAQLRQENFRIVGFFDQVRVREVPVTDLMAGDPELISFFNVNHPEELAQARQMIKRNPKAF
ncbi:molybdenum cofactor guanylyltransferase [Pseudodesulfovibrio piezophilus]|uniref:Probable molybdenum cofactor guanylyltransferase n=1 Tax=Pseudodesulfovibrio piezophilus (strain DSM 21447 / JCM 15486 / C1TLV30) TaxID=1322246 RepID=M1WXF5_PSEP2|nr:molybdenum cofactor guanylyltransferase [Pseudodesulfovibrio piezophilus]CCH49708.1 putative molybdopterin-guanine dinucleotide biosynthesis protein A [Pseudodesulfovibrio piezophilus C1TLV30]